MTVTAALAPYMLGARTNERRGRQCRLPGQHFADMTDSCGSAAPVCDHRMQTSDAETAETVDQPP